MRPSYALLCAAAQGTGHSKPAPCTRACNAPKPAGAWAASSLHCVNPGLLAPHNRNQKGPPTYTDLHPCPLQKACQHSTHRRRPGLGVSQQTNNGAAQWDTESIAHTWCLCHGGPKDSASSWEQQWGRMSSDTHRSQLPDGLGVRHTAAPRVLQQQSDETLLDKTPVHKP